MINNLIISFQTDQFNITNSEMDTYKLIIKKFKQIFNMKINNLFLKKLINKKV